MNTHFSKRRIALGLAVWLPASLLTLASLSAPPSGAPPSGGRPAGGGAPPRGGFAPHPALPPSRPAFAPTGPAFMERPTHGTIRHLDTHAVERPVQIRPEPQQRGETVREFTPRPNDFVRHDVDVDVHRHRGVDDFHFHRHLGVLPFGFFTLDVGGAPYYYYNGIYYQPVDGGYDVVYPPDGANIPQPPDGAVPIYAGTTTYYYAGGAFYAQQPDGTYVVVAAPIGVIVPELPPDAVQVTINGMTAYQFNNVYYEPVFVNGVTQYQTFMPTG